MPIKGRSLLENCKIMGEPKVISDAVGFKKAVKDTGRSLN
jgi:hypothetical protein